MKKAKVYMYDKMAGILTEDENGFHFQYDQSYLKSKGAEPVSLTLPLTDNELRRNRQIVGSNLLKALFL
jgi:serine/threonine-protein kinase HipA